MVFAICFAIASITVYLNAFSQAMIGVWMFSLTMFCQFLVAFFCQGFGSNLLPIKLFINKATANGLTKREAILRGTHVSIGLLVLIPLAWKFAHS
jgi:ABC-type spermidine/putrescine transport system permease subunit II